MKILMVNKFLHPNGGSETYIFKLGEELCRLGHEVQYFGMEHENRIVGNDINVYTSNMDFHTGKIKKILYPFKIIYSLEAKKKMMQVLEDFQPDIVHINNFNFQLTPSILYAVKEYRGKTRKKVKLIYTAHDYQLVCPNHMMQNPATGELCQKCISSNTFSCVKGRCLHNSFIKSVLAYAENVLYKSLRTYKLFDTIICPSKFLKEKFDSDKILKEKTIVMHNFVDKQSIDVEEKGNYVLYLGRFSKEKGVETLLEVCQLLPEIQFYFAGSGPMEEKVNQVSNVVNLGFLSGEKLYSTIAKARFTIFPSEWYENCPFTVIESQLYGTPVIASNLGGTPELIQEKITGELFEKGNIEELKEKIRVLWQDIPLQKKYSKACKQIQFDSLTEYAQKVLEIYKA